MKPKQLTLVLVLAVVLGGLGYWMNRRAVPPSTSATLGGKVLPDFPLNDVTVMVFRDGTNELSLARRDGIWRVRERFDYPANFGDISEFLRKVWELKAVQTEPVGERGLERLELIEPAEGRANAGTLVVFKDASDRAVAGLVLGRQRVREAEAPSQFGDGSWPVGRWVRAVDGPPEAALVSETFSNIEIRPDRWIDKEFFKVEKFKRAEVTHPDPEDSWTIYRETEGGELRLADLGEGEALDTGKAASVGNLLSWPSFTDLAPPDASPEATGLATPVVASIETFDGFNYTVKVGGKTDTNDNYHLQVSVAENFPKQREAAEDETPEDKERLDREFKERLEKQQEKLAKEQRFDGWTYLVSSWTVENLLKPRSDFLKAPDATPGSEEDDEPLDAPWSSQFPGVAPRIEDLAGLPSIDDLPPLPEPQREVLPSPPSPPSPAFPTAPPTPPEAVEPSVEPASPQPQPEEP